MLPLRVIEKPQASKTPRAKVQKIESIPAPIGGLNSRDALASMPPTDAYGLVNWIPRQYGVESRKGYSEWATGMAGSVGSIMSYFSSSTTIPTTTSFQTAPTSMPGKVFAATDAKIFDITSQGASPSSPVTLSGSANAGSFSYVNFSNSAGSWLLACSETDGYYTYDGATWVKVTMGAGATQVSVGDPTKFCAVALWKRRVWFVEKSSARVWYLATDSIYGAAASLDLGPLLKTGGSIAYIANWTIDAGTGIDDMLVIVSENGDVIIYKGTDPSSASTFSLVGVWYVGEVPKGRNAFTSYGGDLLIVSNTGIFPVSYITRGGANILAATSDGNYTSKIQNTFSSDISTTFNFFGWNVVVVPRENFMLITVPSTIANLYVQYAMNTATNMWTQFNGLPMTTVNVVANWVMFGTSDGRVCLYGVNYTDNNPLSGATGNPIVGQIQPAFTYFNRVADISQNKHFLMVRPTFLSSSEPGIAVQMNADFLPGAPLTTPGVPAPVGYTWDSGIWDSAIWSGTQSAYKKWIGVEGFGFSGQVSYVTSVTAQTTFIANDYMIEPGGPM